MLRMNQRQRASVHLSTTCGNRREKKLEDKRDGTIKRKTLLNRSAFEAVKLYECGLNFVCLPLLIPVEFGSRSYIH